jgi:hypothetical protein
MSVLDAILIKIARWNVTKFSIKILFLCGSSIHLVQEESTLFEEILFGVR